MINRFCLVKNTNKIRNMFTYSAKKFYIFVDKKVDCKFFFCWNDWRTTHLLPAAVRIHYVNNYFCELNNWFDGIIKTYPAFLWTTQADWHIHHRTTSTKENDSMREIICMVKIRIWIVAYDGWSTANQFEFLQRRQVYMEQLMWFHYDQEYTMKLLLVI